MTIFEYVISGGILGLVTLMFKNNMDSDKKICRVYERLDETKEYQEQHFTRNDLCQLTHKQVDAKLTEIATDVKALLNRMKNEG